MVDYKYVSNQNQQFWIAMDTILSEGRLWVVSTI